MTLEQLATLELLVRITLPLGLVGLFIGAWLVLSGE